MSVGLIVERRGKDASRITIDQWKLLVSQHADLRLRVEPYIAVVPRTGQRIAINVGEADSEILDEGEWLPFLRYRRGTLTTEYLDEIDEPSNLLRRMTASIAKQLNAVVTTDAADEFLHW